MTLRQYCTSHRRSCRWLVFFIVLWAVLAALGKNAPATSSPALCRVYYR